MNEAEIKAVLHAQSALLVALARTSVRPSALLQEFDRLVEVALESEQDADTAELLQMLRVEFRRAIAAH